MVCNIAGTQSLILVDIFCEYHFKNYRLCNLVTLWQSCFYIAASQLQCPVSIGFFWIVQFPPTSPKHTSTWTDYAELPLDVNECVCPSILDVFPHHSQCSQDRIHVHCDKVVSEEECMNKCCKMYSNEKNKQTCNSDSFQMSGGHL